MDATFEIRWFFRGAAPQAVHDWFMSLDPEKESVRTDVYLHTADPDLNVKLREGKSEAKRRLPGGGPVRLTEHVAGHAEHWRKFSFKTKDDDPLSSEGRATGLWVDVDKTRYQLSLDFADLPAHVRDGQEIEDMEVKIELTQVHLEETEWWTICAETEGAPDALEAAFVPAARYLFEDYPGEHALTDADTRGYARWLLDEWHPSALEAGASEESREAAEALPS